MATDYTTKTKRVIDNGNTNDFSKTDFRDLALACADQAGVSASKYDKIAAIMADVCDDTQPTGG